MMELVHVADLTILVAEPIEIGQTASGLRRVIPIVGGEVRGPMLSGRVIPASGADFQLIRADGVAELHAKYAIETSGGERVYIENSGLRHGPAEAMARLQRGEVVDPALIYFRTVPRFETTCESLNWLTRYVFVGDGVRRPDQVELKIYQVK